MLHVSLFRVQDIDIILTIEPTHLSRLKSIYGKRSCNGEHRVPKWVLYAFRWYWYYLLRLQIQR